MGTAELPSPPQDATLAHWLEVALWPGVSGDADAMNRLLRDARTREARLEAPTRSGATTRFTHLPMRVLTDPGPDLAQVTYASERRGPPLPIVVGSGEVDLVCGACGFIVCRAIGKATSFAGLMFGCPSCAEVVVLDLDDTVPPAGVEPALCRF